MDGVERRSKKRGRIVGFFLTMLGYEDRCWRMVRVFLRIRRIVKKTAQRSFYQRMKHV